MPYKRRVESPEASPPGAKHTCKPTAKLLAAIAETAPKKSTAKPPASEPAPATDLDAPSPESTPSVAQKANRRGARVTEIDASDAESSDDEIIEVDREGRRKKNPLKDESAEEELGEFIAIELVQYSPILSRTREERLDSTCVHLL